MFQFCIKHESGYSTECKPTLREAVEAIAGYLDRANESGRPVSVDYLR
jgi:hypothetical protein